jgi:hypothetical protein
MRTRGLLALVLTSMAQATWRVKSKLWPFIECRVDITIRESEDELMSVTRTLLVMVAYMIAANVLMLIVFGA